MSLTLTFEIELQADYHISAGTGKGSEVDSALLRDGDGAPVLRGTTLVGLLSDSLWRLLQLDPLQKKYRRCKASGLLTAKDFCGQFNQADALCPICYLFGTPYSPKRLQVGSGRPVWAEIPLEQNQYPNHIGSQVVYHVRVDPRTRRASSRQLFSQENGDGRLCFRFEVNILGNSDILLDQAALLVAVARNVRELGRARRRGQGKCFIHLVAATIPDLTQEVLLERFEQRWLLGQVNLSSESISSFPQVTPNLMPEFQPKRFQLIIRLDEPVLIAERGEAGNQFNTQHIIAGTTLRGAFARQVAEHNDLTNPSTYADFVDLFQRGQVDFPFLYPLHRRENTYVLYPSIPTPFDGLTCKLFPGLESHQHQAQWMADLSAAGNKSCPICLKEGKQTALKHLSGFITLTRDLQTIEPQIRNEMHIRLDPQNQRVKPGDLFGYTALEIGQYFVGEMRFANETAWQTFREMTALPEAGQPFTLRLGKATRRGYGKVTVCLFPSDDQEPTWIYLPFQERVSLVEQILTLTLLTDAIVYDRWGRVRLSFEKEWLEQELGLQIAEMSVYARTYQADSFNDQFGLPRRRERTIKAGSAVGLRLSTPLTPEQSQHLQGLEQEGIGLRRNEGFGQIVFNHPIYKSGHQRIRSSNIKSSVGLRLGQIDRPDARQNEDKFRQDWIKILDDEPEWSSCKFSEFTAVAQWLSAKTNQDIALDDLHQVLQKLGQPDQELTNLIPDYGQRSKENRLKRPELQAGFNLILRVFRTLQEKVSKLQTLEEKRTYTSLGLRLLADRLAAEAKLTRKENDR